MSNRLVKLPDTAEIVTISQDGYGDATATSSITTNCAFFQSFSQEQLDNEELLQSDAYAYLDTTNQSLKALAFQLQGLYFKTSPFGGEQWYTITTVQVAQRKLLTNEVNNVLVNLQVSPKPRGA